MKIKNIPKWILTHLSVLTMVLMPVAQGHAAEKQQQEITRAMLQNAIIEMGLNKSMTYGEFYKKNKDKYPVRLQKELGPYFTKFANQPMPQFDLGSAKSSDGKTYPTLRISQNGQLHNVQFFGETERYAKFNNTILTEVDLINFDDALIRVMAGDAKLRQQVEPSKETSRAKKNKFEGYPEISVESWKKMKPLDRAMYIVNLREMWKDSKEVLKFNAQKKKKKFSIFELLMNDSNAQPKSQPNSQPPVEILHTPTSTTSDPTPPAAERTEPEGTQCIVAGYISTYINGRCSINEAIRRQKNNSITDYANKGASDKTLDILKNTTQCKNASSEYACNPLIYGAPNGQPICISTTSSEFQKATWYSAGVGKGSCDEQSRLSNVNLGNKDINIINKKQDYSKVESDSKALLDSNPEYGNALNLSRDYLNGLLKFLSETGKYQGNLGKIEDKKALDENTFGEILAIKKNFDLQISEARKICKLNVDKKHGDPNFHGACDQLHKRILLVTQVLQSTPGCKLDGKINPETLKCSCPDNNPEVIPGNECKATPAPTPPAPVVPPVIPGQVGNCNRICTSNETCKFQVKNEAGVEVWDCVANDVKDPADKDDAAEMKKKKKKERTRKALIGAGSAIAGIGAIVGMYFLFKPKKVKLNPAGDICPDGSNAPCTNTCQSPKIYVTGAGCACNPVCPPGQTLINASCDCGTLSNDVKLVCADEVTIVDNLADCPAPLYTCWDGSKVENAINCPEKPLGTGTTDTKTER